MRPLLGVIAALACVAGSFWVFFGPAISTNKTLGYHIENMPAGDAAMAMFFLGAGLWMLASLPRRSP